MNWGTKKKKIEVGLNVYDNTISTYIVILHIVEILISHLC